MRAAWPVENVVQTDVKDCVWIAQLLEHRLVRGSFLPPVPIRELRDLTRYRAARQLVVLEVDHDTIFRADPATLWRELHQRASSPSTRAGSAEYPGLAFRAP